MLAALFCAAVVTSGCGSSNGSSSPPPGPTPPPGPPAGPLSFGAVVPLAVSPANGTAPAAAIDGSGVAAVLWSQTGLVPVAGQPALVNPYVAARENVAGDTWAATQLVESAAAGDAATDRTLDLQAIGPATGINAAWLRSPTGTANDRVRAARRETPNGWSFGNVAAGVSGVARSELVFAANDAGAQAVAWIEPVLGVPQVQLRVRRIGVADWSAPAGAVQGNPAGVAANPALAMDPAGRVMIVWRQGTTSGELRARTFDVVNGSFSNELQVDANQPDMRSPRVIAYAANRFLAVWEQSLNGVYGLRAKRGDAANWALNSIRVDARSESVSGAQLLIGPNNTALAAWQQADRLFVSRWAEATGNWSQPLEVGAGLSGVARELRAAGDATGRAIVVWTQRQQTGDDLYYALVAAGTPSVTAPTLLEVGSGSVDSPSVAMNAGGAAVVAWRQAGSQSLPDVVARVAR